MNFLLPRKLAALLCALAPLLALRGEGRDPAQCPAAEVVTGLRAAGWIGAKTPVRPGERLGELIAHAGGTLELVPAEDPSESAMISTALLPGNLAYWRCAGFTPEIDWADFYAEWAQWQEQGVSGLVIDLRGNAALDDFAGVAQLAGPLGPNGAPLCTVRPTVGASQTYRFAGSGNRFSGPIAVLIDHATAGAPEALAIALRARGAILFGEPTRGRAAVWGQIPLPNGRTLRLVRGTVEVSPGAPLWHQPVAPDLVLRMNPRQAAACLAKIDQHGVLDVVREAAVSRPFNESALVRGDDPEVERRLAELDRAAGSSEPPEQDTTLVTALDSLKAIRLARASAAAPVAQLAEAHP